MGATGLSTTAAPPPPTSRAATGEVRPEPNGRRMVPSSLIEDAAHAEKKKCSRNTVGRTCTTGSPDQLRTCSASQCCRCCGEPVIWVRLISDTVICEMLTKTSKSPALARCCGRDGRCLKVGRRHAHAEIDAVAALKGAHDIGALRQVADHDFGSGGAQRFCPFIVLPNKGPPGRADDVNGRTWLRRSLLRNTTAPEASAPWT